jgi:putative ABC transport system ATP-binding protein
MIYVDKEVSRARAMNSLKRVGLEHRHHHFATELSGGEQQRVAIARALINDPHLLLADEPTGNLDEVAGTAVMGLLRELNEEGRTIVMVTHDPATAVYAQTTILIRNGIIEGAAE